MRIRAGGDQRWSSLPRPHGLIRAAFARSTGSRCRRVFFVYCSKPFIVARLLCCLFLDLIWRNLLYIPVERETLFRVSLGRGRWRVCRLAQFAL